MADFYKEIVLKFTTDAATGIKDIDDILKRMKAVKEEASKLQVDTKVSYDVISKALTDRAKAAAEEKKADITSKETVLGKLSSTGRQQIAEVNRDLADYLKILSLSIGELKRAASANQEFFGSFKNNTLQEQIQLLNQLNTKLRDTISSSGINPLEGTQIRAVENAEVREFAKRRLETVPLAKPGEPSLGKFEATAYAAAKKDIQEYRQLVKAELSRIVGEYKTAQKLIENIIKESDRRKLQAVKSTAQEELSLIKAKFSNIEQEERTKRETERANLGGSALVTKAKEQAEEAKLFYKAVSDAYEDQVLENIEISKRQENQGDAATASELENGKKKEAALLAEKRARKQVADDAERDYKKIEKASQQSTKSASGGFSQLAGVLKYTFGTILGLSALGILRNVGTFLQRASEEALNFSKAMFTLNIAVRNMQRQGNPTSIGQLREEIKGFREEFGFFSELEVSRAFAEATNKLSNLGYTTEQVANVVRAGMVVYVTDLTGRFNDLGEAINGVTNYLASGYGESLERSGFIAGRAGDKLLAFEKGLGQSLASLDPLTLSQERYNLLLAQTAEKSEDAAAFTQTLAGAYKQAQADIVNATVNIGKAFDEDRVAIEKLKALILSGIAEGLKGEIGTGDVENYLEQLSEKYKLTLENISQAQVDLERAREKGLPTKEREEDLKYYTDLKNQIEQVILSMIDMDKLTSGTSIAFGAEMPPLLDPNNPDSIQQTIESIPLGLGDLIKIDPTILKNINEMSVAEFADWFATTFGEKVNDSLTGVVTVDKLFHLDQAAIVDAYQQMISGLEKITKEETKRLSELWNDYVQDVGGYLKELDGTTVYIEANFVVGKLTSDYLQKIDELEEEYANKVNTVSGAIEKSYQEKVAQAEKDYNLQLTQAIRNFNIRRAQLDRNYRLKELQAEREYQEELRKLREGYLMDLEDALRERDALQVIRLSREYTLQKDQAKRQYDLDKQARKEAYEEEKKQLAIEQAERMQQLYEEYQAKLEALLAEKEQERVIAKEEYEKARAEEKARYDEAVAERKTRFENDQKELEKETKFKIEEFIKRLREEGVLTEGFIDDFSAKLKEKLGEGSEYKKIMDYFEQVAITKTTNVGNLFATLMARIAALSSLGGAIQQEIDQLPDTPTPQARYWGGTIISTKPTTVTFGENEPEFVEITPLSKLSRKKAAEIASDPLASEEARFSAASVIGNGENSGNNRNDTSLLSIISNKKGTQVFESGKKGTNESSKHVFELLLSPDLEIRLVDKALSETSDVIFNVLREQR